MRLADEEVLRGEPEDDEGINEAEAETGEFEILSLIHFFTASFSICEHVSPQDKLMKEMKRIQSKSQLLKM